jgi:Phage integrase, N-terminal SAM-like domain
VPVTTSDPQRESARKVETGVTFVEAAAEYLRFSEEDRGCKPSTIRNYRNAIDVHLLPVFGAMAVEDVSVREVERWRAGMSSARQERELSKGWQCSPILMAMPGRSPWRGSEWGTTSHPCSTEARARP